MIPRPQSVGEQSLGQATGALFELGERDDLAGGGDHGGPLSVAGGVGGGAEMRGAGVVGAHRPLLAHRTAARAQPGVGPDGTIAAMSFVRLAVPDVVVPAPERMPESASASLGRPAPTTQTDDGTAEAQMAITPRSRQGHRGVPASPVKEPTNASIRWRIGK